MDSCLINERSKRVERRKGKSGSGAASYPEHSQHADERMDTTSVVNHEMHLFLFTKNVTSDKKQQCRGVGLLLGKLPPKHSESRTHWWHRQTATVNRAVASCPLRYCAEKNRELGLITDDADAVGTADTRCKPWFLFLYLHQHCLLFRHTSVNTTTVTERVQYIGIYIYICICIKQTTR